MHEFHVKKTYSLKDESFTPGFCDNSFLSLELSFESLSFCILDTDRYKYRQIESYEFGGFAESNSFIQTVEDIIKNNVVYQTAFERVTLLYISPQSVFIPSSLYSEEEKTNYLGFNHIINSGDITCAEKLYNLDAYAIYPLPGLLKNTFDNIFTEYRLRHFSTALIESVLYDVRYGGYHADMVLHVQKGHFEILILDSGNLVFFNSFNYQTWDDLMYYMFYVMEQANISAENINLLMVGQASMDSELYKNLKPYFKNVDFGSRSDLYKYDEVFDEIPHHYFYNLLNANACG